MKIHFSKILTCPYDKGEDLDIKELESKNGEILKGLLICESCKRCYPIRDYIPIIVPDELRNSNFEKHFVQQYRDSFTSDLRIFDNLFDKDYIFEPLNFPYRFETTKKIDDFIKTKSGSLSLDAGCGTGTYFNYFKGDFVGLDLTFDLLKKARSVIPKEKDSHLVMADMALLPFKDNTFDFLVCSQTLEHLEETEIEESLEQFEKVCSGNILMDVPNHSKLTDCLRDVLYSGWREGDLDNKLLLHHSSWDIHSSF